MKNEMEGGNGCLGTKDLGILQIKGGVNRKAFTKY